MGWGLEKKRRRKNERRSQKIEKKALGIRNKILNQAISYESKVQPPLSVYVNKKKRNQKIEEQNKKKRKEHWLV